MRDAFRRAPWDRVFQRQRRPALRRLAWSPPPLQALAVTAQFFPGSDRRELSLAQAAL